MEKRLSEITRKEWIIYTWEENTGFDDNERCFVMTGERTPDEALEAAEGWDFLQSVKEGTELESNDEIES